LIVWLILTNRLPDWQIDWLTDRLTDWLTDWLTDRLTDWLTDWLTDRLTDWQIDWLTDWLTDRLTDWLTDWLTNCSAGWLAGWLTDYLIDRLINQFMFKFVYYLVDSLTQYYNWIRDILLTVKWINLLIALYFQLKIEALTSLAQVPQSDIITSEHWPAIRKGLLAALADDDDHLSVSTVNIK